MKVEQFRQFLAEQKKRPEAVQEIESKGSVNAWLMAMYQAQTNETVFRTAKGWRELGFIIKSGESSYPVFSRPAGVLKAEKSQTAPELDDANAKHFFICHLFHQGQVRPINEKSHDEQN